MTTKEKVIEKYNSFREAFDKSGIPKDGQDAYIEGYLNGTKAIQELIQEDGFLLFPGFGTPVYKLVWDRDAVRGYLRKVKHYKSVLQTEMALKEALKEGNGTITVEQREFCKTDILIWGTLTFDTREEAEAALERYKNLSR